MRKYHEKHLEPELDAQYIYQGPELTEQNRVPTSLSVRVGHSLELLLPLLLYHAY